VEDAERRKIAAEVIAFELGRLKAQADANGLKLLTYLIEVAEAEAQEMLTAHGKLKK
jgi:hypothetical protein